jgi:hypothetical protein
VRHDHPLGSAARGHAQQAQVKVSDRLKDAQRAQRGKIILRVVEVDLEVLDARA